MKTTILEIIIALILSVSIYVVFSKLIIIQSRKNNNHELTNLSTTLNFAVLLIVFTLIFTALIEPIFSSYKVIKMGVTNSKDLWFNFIPLLGQYLVLMIIIFFFLKLLSKYIFKLLFVNLDFRASFESDEKHVIALYGILFILITCIVRFYIIELGMKMIPVGQSIF